MWGGDASTAKRLELARGNTIAAPGAATSSTQLPSHAGLPTALGPYGRTLTGSPATSLVGQPTTSSVSQVSGVVQQYPGLSAVGTHLLSVRLGGLAEARQHESAAGPVASSMRLGGHPPAATYQIQASRLIRVPISPPDGGDVAMQPLPPAVGQCVVPTTPAKAKPRMLKRSDQPPETVLLPKQFLASRESEVALLRQQLVETHGRAGALSG
jgi:hypothetical protein